VRISVFKPFGCEKILQQPRRVVFLLGKLRLFRHKKEKNIGSLNSSTLCARLWSSFVSKPFGCKKFKKISPRTAITIVQVRGGNFVLKP
jgi:hypothetical protein